MDTLNSNPLKHCSKCGVEYPATLLNYYKEPRGKYGVSSVCKNCSCKTANRRPRPLPPSKEGYKQCPKCGNEYPKTRDYFNKKGDSLTMWCKTCINQGQGVRRTKNKDDYNDYQRNWADKNRKKVRATKTRWRNDNPEYWTGYYQKHREIIVQRASNWYGDHKERHQATTRQWIANNSERYRLARLGADQRRRARVRNLPDTFTTSDWSRCLDYFGGLCVYCGSQQGLWNSITADHFIPLDSPDCTGTVPTNIVPACKSCNSGKRNKHPVTWLISRYGKKRAAEILARIQAYFDWIKSLPTNPP